MKFVKTLLVVFLVALFMNQAQSQTVIQIQPADGLTAAIAFANANPGAADVIELITPGGVYDLDLVTIEVPLTIRGTDMDNPPVLKPDTAVTRTGWIVVDNDLTVDGVIIDGQAADGSYAMVKYMFQVNNPEDPAAPPINEAPELVVLNSHLKNIYQNGDPTTAADGSFFDISRSAYAGVVHFENTTLENCGDEGIRSINAHKDPVHSNGTAIGSLVVRNCTFNNINGTAIKVESDGDSTTYDGELLIENVTFYNCQRRVIWERDYAGSIYRNLIIANSKIGNDTFGGTDVLISHQRDGSTVSHVDTFNVQGVKANGDTVRLGGQAFFVEGGRWSGSSDVGDNEWTTVYEYDPMFADPENGDFTLQAGSRLYRLAHDGGALGDRRWATNPPMDLTVVPVAPADGLTAAIMFANANPGAADILELTEPGGVYELDLIDIAVPLVIRGTDPANPPIIKAVSGITRTGWIVVDNDLTLDGVVVDGQANDGVYALVKYMFQVNNPPDTNPVNLAPRLTVMNSHLKNIYQEGDPSISENGSFFDVSLTAYAGALHFENTTFENNGDEGIRSINAHKTPVHPKNGAFGSLIVRNCTFVNVNGSAIKIESDGDSLTTDAPVLIESVTFYNCQRRVFWERDFENTEVRNIIVANSKLGNDTFGGSDVLMSLQRRGSYVTHIDTFNIQGIKADGDTVTLGPEAFVMEGGRWSGSSDVGEIRNTIYNHDPQFVDAANGDFRPRNGRLYTQAFQNREVIGDQRWADQSVVGIADDSRISTIPEEFALDQNYPNPFNPTTTIRFSIDSPGKVKLQVYNVLGALVETLVDENRSAGKYSITWDASSVASGVYFYRLTGENNKVLIRKMMLLK